MKQYIIDTTIEENLNIYLKLFILLYADDTVIMAESREDLHAQLNVFGEYCNKQKSRQIFSLSHSYITRKVS
jgi:hypothetical protein